MTRKTFDVADMVAMTNEMLANSTCSPEIRKGWMGALEQVLFKTGNYKGFRYLSDIDDTRVQYF